MKGSTDKCHLILSREGVAKIHVVESLIQIQHLRKIHQRLGFDDYLNFLCKNANEKLKALANVTPYMPVKKGSRL